MANKRELNARRGTASNFLAGPKWRPHPTLLQRLKPTERDFTLGGLKPGPPKSVEIRHGYVAPISCLGVA
jgi:hypothetical protein